jgi:hypothetical protein
MMTTKEFYRQEKRALDRLNPKMLSSGAMVNRNVPCAIGAYRIAEAKKGRVEPRNMEAPLPSYQNEVKIPYQAADDLVSENEGFKHLDNSDETMVDRYAHIYDWVSKKAK